MHSAIARTTRAVTAAAVMVAIVLASAIGLNAWADEVTVHAGDVASGG